MVFAWQPSLNAILIGYSIGIGFTVLLFYRPAVHALHTNSTSSSLDRPKRIRQIITFTMPLFPLAIVGWISSLGDRFIIGALLDYKAVGIYAAAYGLVFQPFLIVGGIIELTIRPIYYKAVSNHEYKREKKSFICWLILTAAISATGFGLVFASHQWIAELFLGSEFRQASVLMPWIAAGAGLLTIGYVFEKPFYAYMQTRNVLHIHVIGAIASILACLVLITAYGLKGAAAAVPLYFGLQCLVAAYLNKKRIKAQI
jgi:O-antigen/teichoic acid export membrane protein